MVYFIINWVLGSLSLLLMSTLFPGFRVAEFASALVAAGVVGLLNAGLAILLHYSTGRLGIALAGTFLVISDSFLFRLAGLIIPGFAMRGFFPAFAGGFLLLALNLVLPRVMPVNEDQFGLTLSGGNRRL